MSSEISKNTEISQNVKFIAKTAGICGGLLLVARMFIVSSPHRQIEKTEDKRNYYQNIMMF